MFRKILILLCLFSCCIEGLEKLRTHLKQSKPNQADIVILFETSFYVKESDYSMQTLMAENILNIFQNQNTRFAVIGFSDSGEKISHFTSNVSQIVDSIFSNLHLVFNPYFLRFQKSKDRK